MNKLLFLCIATIFLKSTAQSSCQRDDFEKAACQKNYSLELTQDYKKEKWVNEKDELVIRHIYFSSHAPLQMHLEIHSRENGSSMEISVAQDGKRTQYYTNSNGTTITFGSK